MVFRPLRAFDLFELSIDEWSASQYNDTHNCGKERKNMNDELDIVTLTDENGVEAEFAYLDLVSYEGDDYVVLLPLPDDESGEVVILKVEPIEGNEEMEDYVSIDDEAVLDAVFEIFCERLDD